MISDRLGSQNLYFDKKISFHANSFMVSFPGGAAPIKTTVALLHSETRVTSDGWKIP